MDEVKKQLQFAHFGEKISIDGILWRFESTFENIENSQWVIDIFQRNGWETKIIDTKFKNGLWSVAPFAFLIRRR